MAKLHELLAKFRPGDKVTIRGGTIKEQQGMIESVQLGGLYVVKLTDGRKQYVSENDLQLHNEKEKQQKQEEQNQELIKEKEENNKKKTNTKGKIASFAVITKDYVNETSSTAQTKETIVTGTTKNGVVYEAQVYGKNITRNEIEHIADSRILSQDLTTARQDKAFSNDRIQEMLNDNSNNYVIYTNGNYILGEEINDNQTLAEAENLEDFGSVEEIKQEHKSTLDELASQARNSDAPSFYETPDYDPFDGPDFGGDPRVLE